MENTITFFSSLCNNFRKLLKSFKKNHAGRESIVKLNAILLSLFLGGFFNGFTGNVAQSQNPCTDEIIEWKVNMTIESPMTISGNTLLLIHPGILIEFTNPDAKLVIFGSIEAIGSETQTISFFSDHPDGWGGIDIDNAGPSTFKYCNFSNINRITRYEDSDINPGGIIITILLGIGGAFLGGFIGSFLGLGTVTGFNVGSLLLAIGGAVLLLILYRFIKK